MTTDTRVIHGISPTETSVSKYGAQLSAAEEADLDNRIELQDGLLPLIEWANNNPENLSGVWLDQVASGGNGAVVKVGLVGEQRSSALSAMSLAPIGASVEFVDVTFSAADLNEAQDRVLAGVEDLARSGTVVTGVSLNTASNRVEVMTVGGSKSAVERIHPAIAAVDDPGFARPRATRVIAAT